MGNVSHAAHRVSRRLTNRRHRFGCSRVAADSACVRLPLDKRIGLITSLVIFKCGNNRHAYVNRLIAIPQEIADHPNVSGMGQFDQNDNIGDLVLQRRLNGMPDSLPTIYDTSAFDLYPFHVVG